MKVVILCGGLGTRIREETETKPKPMVEIGGKPILWHIMKMYSSYGFSEFVLCLGYKKDYIKNYFLNHEELNSNITIDFSSKDKIILHDKIREKDWKITMIDTGDSALTGVRVKRIEKFITDDTFMLTYGDGVSDVNIAELLKFHKSHGKIGTVTGVRPPSRFGELIIDNNQVTSFTEKPDNFKDQRFINGGFFVLNKEFFKYLSDKDSCVLEKEPLINLANDKQLMVYKHLGFWQCMDTFRDLQLLESLWKTNPIWKKWDD
ncbi:MAG: glucose-1-phosphate cytidylyltransferase [Candidatus Aenigmarchaeota archaeon]|nr:glucose-1-phosphate cytidylyltransferase [Candidatus Aenigmarchaeota archaeon]